MSKKGIDVSYANGSIEWSAVKGNIDFAIIRSSFGSDLPSQTDSFFYQNAAGCQKNGIPFGTYHFAYFVDETTAKNEADFAIRLAGECGDVKFIALDIEEDSEKYARRVGKSPDWTNCAVVFLERVKSAGYVPILYSNQDWLINKLNYERMRAYKLWYAAPDVSSPRYSPAIWQYSWKGQIPGIGGDVDMNECFDDELFSSSSTSAGTSTKKTEVTEIHQILSSQKVDLRVKVVSSIGVNIRNGAAVKFDAIGAIPYGAEVDVTRQTEGGGYTWGLTSYNGITGWIALDYTERVNKLKKGDLVKVRSGAKVYNTDTKLSEWVSRAVFSVMEISSDGERIVIGKDGNVTAAVSKNDLILVK